MEEKKESIWHRVLVKLTSVKTWLALFSAVMLAVIIFTKQAEFKELGYGFLVVIASYLGVNVLQKKMGDR